MFVKLLPANNNVETPEFKLDFADPPSGWVWSAQEEELDMSRRVVKRSNESVEDMQELKHQLFDKGIDVMQTEMLVEKAALESQLQDAQLKLNKAAEEKENIEAQLQKWAAEKLEKEADLSSYAAQTQEFGKKIASVNIILTGFSEFISYNENKN